MGSAASIVPPPFGSGYRSIAVSPGDNRIASIVPPPFGSGYSAFAIRRGSPGWRFNRAAPFRERLSEPATAAHMPVSRFNRAAPFRERLSDMPAPAGWRNIGFNRAAPFRERLCPQGSRGRWRATPGFNRAAPFRERLCSQAPVRPAAVRRPLQSCRPLSGAVMAQGGYVLTETITASIVPPPFGSGYSPAPGCRRHSRRSFNRAAPFRERLSLASQGGYDYYT